MTNDNRLDRMRRLALARLAALGVMGGGYGFIARALAAESKQGFTRLKGRVTLDGKPAALGQIVRRGQHIATGATSEAVVVIGQDAFLLRENTEFSIDENALVPTLRYISGKILSVFGKGEKKLHTPTAVIGIRGTGCYIEVERETERKRTYFCLCYGEAEVTPLADAGRKEVIKTLHHEHPLYIGDQSAPLMMAQAPVINHTDAEVIMLEGLVGRKPPFYGLNLPPYNM